jgi:hypothetical protein
MVRIATLVVFITMLVILGTCMARPRLGYQGNADDFMEERLSLREFVDRLMELGVSNDPFVV